MRLIGSFSRWHLSLQQLQFSCALVSLSFDRLSVHNTETMYRSQKFSITYANVQQRTSITRLARRVLVYIQTSSYVEWSWFPSVVTVVSTSYCPICLAQSRFRRIKNKNGSVATVKSSCSSHFPIVVNACVDTTRCSSTASKRITYYTCLCARARAEYATAIDSQTRNYGFRRERRVYLKRTRGRSPYYYDISDRMRLVVFR